MSVIDEIKTRIDIVDLVSETVQLRRAGKNYSGFCPFHPNQRTPAFFVFPETGTWRCFGQCNEGGDIFRFVMKKENWDFPETLHFLAERAGVQLKPPTEEQQISVEEHDLLRNILEEVHIFYHNNLMNSSSGKAAREYLLEKRCLRQETIESFGLGYAPHSWNATLTYLTSKGYKLDDLRDAGMVSEREPSDPRKEPKQAEPGKYYDRFRNRIMIPIRDMRGRMAGFGARILDPQDIPKFLNSPQTPIFDKSRLLYGLDRARKAIRQQDQAVIVEGYFDVIALHQSGYENAISPMGTALTEQQLRLLKRFSHRIVLALDSDAAGDKATIRGLQLARQTMDHEQEPVFDARGLLRYEARLQADIRISTLPPGSDPDDVVNKDPQMWQAIIEKANPVVIHVMETLAAEKDIDDPKSKNEIAAQILPLIQDVPSPIERDTYLQRLARLLRVSEKSLLEIAPFRPRAKPSGRLNNTVNPPIISADGFLAPSLSAYSLEAHCLGILLRRPGSLYQVDRNLQQEGLSRLTVDDFEHADHKSIIRVFQESIDQDLAEPLEYVFNNLSLPLMELADDLLARTSDLNPNEQRVLEDLMRGLLDLRLRKLLQEMDYQKSLIEESQSQGDFKATKHLHYMSLLADARRRIDHAMKKFTSRALAGRQ